MSCVGTPINMVMMSKPVLKKKTNPDSRTLPKTNKPKTNKGVIEIHSNLLHLHVILGRMVLPPETTCNLFTHL